MSTDITDGEHAFQHLKGWVKASNVEIAKGDPPDTNNSVDAFTALNIVLDHVEQFMSVDRRRAMALDVEKALTP